MRAICFLESSTTCLARFPKSEDELGLAHSFCNAAVTDAMTSGATGVVALKSR